MLLLSIYLFKFFFKTGVAAVSTVTAVAADDDDKEEDGERVHNFVFLHLTKSTFHVIRIML